ncbi:hypothetical protein [uncultured Tateyamaria sp.]|uniref:hypothetical protein n=1 Tax=uncultured Tateyamaria sp. TaxID=455651 RepID=UPI002629530E|nr:hypothetical protein [uncultured Tateyamaria sp.]
MDFLSLQQISTVIFIQQRGLGQKRGGFKYRSGFDQRVPPTLLQMRLFLRQQHVVSLKNARKAVIRFGHNDASNR